MAGRGVLETAFERLRKFALAYPETREDHPWGDTLIKVKGKTFVFMGCDGKTLALSVKLPQRKEFALEYPFASPTAYGLGKSGWITAKFEKKDNPPLDILEAWIDESFRAIAPKKLLVAMNKDNGSRGDAETRSRKTPKR
jgi:predicted DNA-binding protein (MmcQ/YjbR family)